MASPSTIDSPWFKKSRTSSSLPGSASRRTRSALLTFVVALLDLSLDRFCVLWEGSERRYSCLGDRLILLAATPAHSYRPDDQAVAAQRDAASEDHDPAMVRVLDAVELLAGLSIFGQVLGSDVEGARRKGLVDRDVDAAHPRVVHANVGNTS